MVGLTKSASSVQFLVFSHLVPACTSKKMWHTIHI